MNARIDPSPLAAHLADIEAAAWWCTRDLPPRPSTAGAC